MESDVKELLGRFAGLRSERTGWESHWQELAEYLLPRRADFSGGRQPGAKRTEKQYDGTPMLAARNLAAAIDGLLKPKNARWFSVKPEDGDLAEDETVKLWLRRAEDRMAEALYEPRARFVQYGSEVDLDLVVFGTGVLYVGESVGTGRLQFRSHHLRDSYVAVNEEGDVDTVFLVQRLTARQAQQRFGADRLGERTREALDRDEPDREFEFLRVCLPRLERDHRRADAANLPYAAIDIDVESEHRIAESGHAEFPYVVPRWETSTDEIYGRGPGMLALPDAKTLNQMGKTLLKAGHKAVDPPLLAPSDSFKSQVRTWPGGISYYDANALGSAGGRIPIQPLHSGANMPLGREMQNDVREQVWSAFFRNVLNLPTQGPQMTATEILERKEEFIRVIGPVFGRLEADYTGPLVERAFNILYRAGRFGLPPDALFGARLKFEYASPITKAQRMIEVAALGKTGQDLAQVAAVAPQIMDNFDHDKIAREVAEANGLPQDWLLSPARVAKTRAARAMQEAARQFGPAVAGLEEPSATGVDVDTPMAIA
jgi:hypothetical protein